MIKAMIFIDGTWLYSNTSKLSELHGDPNYHIDFGKLPNILGSEVALQMAEVDVDVVRTYLFASNAVDYDLRDQELVDRRRDFFDMLREEHHYELEIYPISFKGRRLRKADRDPKDTFEPKEKCVDIALASTMLYMAAIPGAYDVAIAVIGDRDFMPVLQTLRKLGKRVAIASIKSSCAPEFADPLDQSRVKDFDTIWLESLLTELELKYERRQTRCESPIHRGNPFVWTTYRPRKGRKFFCDDCRAEFQRQRQEAQREFVAPEGEQEPIPVNGDYNSEDAQVAPYVRITGMIKKIIPAKSYGFIEADNRQDYFFHLTDLVNVEFDDLAEGDEVDFEIKRQPDENKAGAAQNVHLRV